MHIYHNFFAFKSEGNNWVTFEDQKETPTSKSALPSRKKTLKDSPSMSYKALLDKSIDDDLTSPLPPEPNKGHPVPPPRASTPDALSMKLMEQAEQFEKSSSRQNSPSLNELRELSKSQKPVPAKRSKQSAKPLTAQGIVYSIIWYVMWYGMLIWYRAANYCRTSDNVRLMACSYGKKLSRLARKHFD
jgi:hypothetical protein